MKRAVALSFEIGPWSGWCPSRVTYSEDKGDRRHFGFFWLWFGMVVSPGYAILTTEPRSEMRSPSKMPNGQAQA